MTDHEAYDFGYDAYWDGVDIEDNPYDQEKEAEKFLSWMNGWRKARTHDTMKVKDDSHLNRKLPVSGSTLKHNQFRLNTCRREELRLQAAICPTPTFFRARHRGRRTG